LRSAARLDEIFRSGETAKGRWVVARALPSGLPFSRAAAAVGRAAGGAVVRNRIRRRLRAAYRQVKAKLPAGWDWVFLARAGAIAAPFPALAEDVEKAARKTVEGKREKAKEERQK
jgi:ribonuclease P protein component